jgi:chaperone required for assembly of F1-ATPase
MSNWKTKRFWKEAVAEPCDGGFTVRLDARLVKTPLKAPLVLPTLAMAQAIAAEWDAQIGLIKPQTMPVTRAANSAIDKIVPQFNEVAGLLAAYGASDLICYRATDPQALVMRQAQAWDPMIAWAADTLHAPLIATAGVMHIAQDAGSLDRLQAQVFALDAFRLAGLHDLVAISGSLVLALAVSHRRLSGPEAWVLSRIDETWQQELWGIDEEAADLQALRERGFLDADRFYQLCG